MFSWILIGIFPAKKTFECLKKPIKGETRHWCIFWSLFAGLICLDPILSYIPFFSVFSTILLVGNYNQHLSELTLKGSIGLCRFSHLKIKNHQTVVQLLDKGQKFFKKQSNNNILNQAIRIFNGLISTFTSLNEGISNFDITNSLKNPLLDISQNVNNREQIILHKIENNDYDTDINSDKDKDKDKDRDNETNADKKVRKGFKTVNNAAFSAHKAADKATDLLRHEKNDLRHEKNDLRNENNPDNSLLGTTGTTLSNIASYISNSLPLISPKSVKENKENKEVFDDNFVLSFN
jgi:hypothetical protein